jgi:hypothetical protein
MKNLDASIGDVHLRNLFENFGEIGSCKVFISLFISSSFGIMAQSVVYIF